MTPDGWEIKTYGTRTNLVEVEYWEDGEKSIEFSITRGQFDELIYALIEAKQ